MTLHIRDPETDQLVRSLAEIKKLGLTEAVKLAVGNELKRIPLKELVRPIQDRIAAMRDTGLEADKAFFDELSGD